jgi:hypothetical protein
MKGFVSFAVTLLLGCAVPAAQLQAAEPYEGRWARTAKECRSGDRPTSKTEIDLAYTIRDKPTPIFDQYENHCLIDRTTRSGTSTVLETTCFEFWEEFEKRVDGRKVRIRLTPRLDGRLTIDGKAYQRCGAK